MKTKSSPHEKIHDKQTEREWCLVYLSVCDVAMTWKYRCSASQTEHLNCIMDRPATMDVKSPGKPPWNVGGCIRAIQRCGAGGSGDAGEGDAPKETDSWIHTKTPAAHVQLSADSDGST